MDVKLKAEGLQKERDFYYNKLRDIESFCRVMEDGYQDPTTTRILALIYETQVKHKIKTRINYYSNTYEDKNSTKLGKQ